MSQLSSKDMEDPKVLTAKATQKQKSPSKSRTPKPWLHSTKKDWLLIQPRDANIGKQSFLKKEHARSMSIRIHNTIRGAISPWLTSVRSTFLKPQEAGVFSWWVCWSTNRNPSSTSSSGLASPGPRTPAPHATSGVSVLAGSPSPWLPKTKAGRKKSHPVTTNASHTITYLWKGTYLCYSSHGLLWRYKTSVHQGSTPP